MFSSHSEGPGPSLFALKITSGTRCALDTFFFLLLCPLWAPKWGPRSPQGSPKGPKGAPKPPPGNLKITKKSTRAPSGKKGGPGGSRGALGKENDTKIEEKTINFDAEDMQKKASIPLCFSTVLGRKIGGTVPKKGEHSVFFLLECNAMQCNTIHYNTMQCNAMQCNGTAQR